jgi:hypothetical protein
VIHDRQPALVIAHLLAIEEAHLHLLAATSCADRVELEYCARTSGGGDSVLPCSGRGGPLQNREDGSHSLMKCTQKQ